LPREGQHKPSANLGGYGLSATWGGLGQHKLSAGFGGFNLSVPEGDEFLAFRFSRKNYIFLDSIIFLPFVGVILK